ncbi:MAG: hypothetical protein K1X63_05195 [Chitinophagales bacterium]|nr:hypothetical protein [Chitinophagales bacterium]
MKSKSVFLLLIKIRGRHFAQPTNKSEQGEVTDESGEETDEGKAVSGIGLFQNSRFGKSLSRQIQILITNVTRRILLTGNIESGEPLQVCIGNFLPLEFYSVRFGMKELCLRKKITESITLYAT